MSEYHIHDAIYNGNLNELKHVVQNNPSRINERDPETPIELAISLGHFNIANYLLNMNARINAGSKGRLLKNAIENRDPARTSYLVDIGATLPATVLSQYIRVLVHEGAHNSLTATLAGALYNARRRRNGMSRFENSIVKKRFRQLLQIPGFRRLDPHTQATILTPK